LFRKHTNTTLLIFFLANCFLCPIEFCGQDSEGERGKYQWFDDIIGETNSGIFKGILYENEYRVINERHQFFESKDFKPGSVVYYGQQYFDVSLKYDMYLDNLLGINYELANEPAMVFDKNGVDKFSIGNTHFENISHRIASEDAGFFEVLLKNDSLKLYKKYQKKIFKRTDEQVIYYEFKDGYSYLLYLYDSYYPFKKVKELNRIFPKYRKELKLISKKHSALKKSNTDDYAKMVLKDFLLLNPSLKQIAL